NFIPGALSGGMFVSSGGERLPLPPGLAGNGQSVIYGIRPEHFEIAEDGLPVTVSLVEPMGTETHITGASGNQSVIAVFHKRVRAEPGTVIRLKPVAEE